MVQIDEYSGPLTGLKVVDFGHYYAGPMVGLMLADQGATVIRVVKPGAPELPEQQHRLFNRNKKLLKLDLKTDEGKAQALELIHKADVVIENFRPGVMKGLGLHYAGVKEDNPSLVYLSLPGFSSTDKKRAHIQAWEGVVSAAAGVFRHASKVREPLGYPPVYSCVPQCSMYAAYNGALGVMAALVAREQHGHGTVLEVPLADSGLLGFILEIWNWNRPIGDESLLPENFKPFVFSSNDNNEEQLKKLAKANENIWINPLGSYYPCSDGREIFIYTLYPNIGRYSKRLTKALGIDDKLTQEGFINVGAWETAYENNISNSLGLSAERMQKLRKIIADVLLTKTALEWEDVFAKAGVAANVIQTKEEWLASKPMLSSGVLTSMDNGRSTLITAGRVCDVSGPGGALSNTGFHEPEIISTDMAEELFSCNVEKKALKVGIGPLKKGDLLNGLTVLELTNMVAGPLAGVFLAEYGADIIKADASQSPSPAAAARGEFLQHGKRSIITDVTTAPGRKVFEQLISHVDVVVHNILDNTALRLGVTHKQLRTISQKVVSAQISAFGGTRRGGWELRPGYDNLLQASSGLMAQFGGLQTPQDHGGIASSDIPGGLMLAFSALLGVYQQRRTGYAGEARTSLARVVSYYQLPNMIAENCNSKWGAPSGQFALGPHPWQRLYECRDGWIYVGVHKNKADQLATLITKNPRVDIQAFEAAFAKKESSYWLELFESADIGCHRVLSLADVYALCVRQVDNNDADEVATDSTEMLRWEEHPYGFPVTLLAPNYVRVGEGQTWKRLRPGPRLGEQTAEILKELGYSENDIDELIKASVCCDYLPAFGSRDVFVFKPELPSK